MYTGKRPQIQCVQNLRRLRTAVGKWRYSCHLLSPGSKPMREIELDGPLFTRRGLAKGRNDESGHSSGEFALISRSSASKQHYLIPVRANAKVLHAQFSSRSVSGVVTNNTGSDQCLIRVHIKYA